MAAKPSGNKSVLVIGLGRFGGSVAATLDQMGQDVLAVDKNPELVARWSAHLPTIQADMTDVLAIEQIDGFCPKAAEVLEEAEADALARRIIAEIKQICNI